MRQVFSRHGQVTVEDVPLPMVTPGAVLVQTAWSLLSSGTERTNISGQRLVDRIRPPGASATGQPAITDETVR